MNRLISNRLGRFIRDGESLLERVPSKEVNEVSGSCRGGGRMDIDIKVNLRIGCLTHSVISLGLHSRRLGQPARGAETQEPRISAVLPRDLQAKTSGRGEEGLLSERNC